jgi:hypothetical protein
MAIAIGVWVTNVSFLLLGESPSPITDDRESSINMI